MSDRGRSETYTLIESGVEVEMRHEESNVDLDDWLDDRRKRERKMAKRKEIERKKVEIEHVKGLLLLLYLGAIVFTWF